MDKKGTIIIIVFLIMFFLILFISAGIEYEKYKEKNKIKNDNNININQNQETITKESKKDKQKLINSLTSIEDKSKEKYKKFTENIINSNKLFYEKETDDNKTLNKNNSKYNKCHEAYNCNKNDKLNDESKKSFNKALSSVVAISTVSIDKDSIFHIFSLGMKKFMNIEENKDPQSDDEIKYAIAFGENINDAKTQNSFYRSATGGLAKHINNANTEIRKYIKLLCKANLNDKQNKDDLKYTPFLLFSLITVFDKNKYKKYEKQYDQNSSFTSIKDQIKMDFSTQEEYQLDDQLFCTELLCQYLEKVLKSEKDDYILQNAIGMIVNAYEINRMFHLASNDNKVVIFVRDSPQTIYNGNKLLWSGLGTGSAGSGTQKNPFPIEYTNLEILQQFTILGKQRLENSGTQCTFESPDINKMSFSEMLETLWENISDSKIAKDRFLAIFTNEQYSEIATELIKPSKERFISQNMYINQPNASIDSKFKEPEVAKFGSSTEKETTIN